jgi:hypothetical protein
MEEMSSREQASRWKKHGLVWINRNKISQIIKDYFYLPFFLLIILWGRVGDIGALEKGKALGD